MFYAPWCKHCKQLEPEFEGAAVELAEWGIRMAKVDGTREKELSDQYGIPGWPGLKMFRKGRAFEYNGPRERDNIITFMKEQFKLPSEQKDHMLGLSNNMDRLDVTVVGFFKEKSDLYDEYMVAANEMRGKFRFMHTFEEPIAKSFKVPQESIVVFQPEIVWSEYENKTYTLTKKSATYREIMHFVKKNSVPLVGYRTKKNDFKYTERPLVVVYYDVNYGHDHLVATQFVREKVLGVAKEFVGSNLKFAVCNEDEFEDEIKSLGFEDSGEDVNVGCWTEKQKFRMNSPSEFETEDLKAFIEELRTGKVSTLKSDLVSLPLLLRILHFRLSLT
jgi:protein disulfide-isomerase A4